MPDWRRDSQPGIIVTMSTIKPNHFKELQHRVRGNVSTANDMLDYFSTDGSVFTIRPKGVVYPKTTADVVATVKYANELAEKGVKIGITARGKGTDQAGGALGDGLMVVFPAHMNRLLKVDKDVAVVQPGLLYRTFQDTLHSHGRFLPPYPSSIDFSSIGGAVANNACGEKTLKYGGTRDWVKSLEVVLADGSVINTRRLSKRELSRKKGLMTLEGAIYRGIDSLIMDNKAIIEASGPHTSKNSAGYALKNVKHKDGSFDLTQLFIGSQGTLGIFTEATIATAAYNPKTTLVVGFFDSIEKAGEAVLQLQGLKPSAMEVVDYYLLEHVRRTKPGLIGHLVPEELPKMVVLIEFDNKSQLQQNLLARRASRILKRFAKEQRTETDAHKQDELWKIRRSAAAVIWQTEGKKKALPIIEDGVVPIEKLPEFLDRVYKLLAKYKLEMAIWGHAGNANFHMQPWMDLSKVKDRKMVFDLMDEFYSMVIKMGGSTCGEHNDGLLRAPYLKKLYGSEMYDLFLQVKAICDPQNILNPRIKLNLTREDIEPLLRKEYSMEHLYDHMPHT